MKYEDDFIHSVIRFVLWVAGLLIGLAVGFGMVDGTLRILFLPLAITQLAGWLAIVAIVVGVILTIIEHLKNQKDLNKK
ncbi:hypothetical protein COU62_02245 [Candidatus Pacearchaeota archaeon CG10_big_fil_rev_8_21_14_0_10_35_219]|nr:hypothetical protein [Candidatus Pacearchaeota archaeon]OIO41965.1 MAG: hypothetical protein AUJ63_04395 [Candidatus Pacearchaeota archaeon CG1_02_35_32]PIO07789.1 MAG: hypothetical protein COU62_02245 [Candidatus Pacearchaeota archaeon CG10_big_fil_rev_8_21_14_0_10_35_219]PIY81011.1 MAG: hypothetical protein COY79_04355 [Candidatus Pacearchaeota archaeon CG_4_10_14_0_8_um_filter_35_169]PIZ79880.1 MAG: hypothetical protein COY00_02660 [Candidatus Pacearchaeota archaeon CG_4_10_14_0_2_um_filt